MVHVVESIKKWRQRIQTAFHQNGFINAAISSPKILSAKNGMILGSTFSKKLSVLLFSNLLIFILAYFFLLISFFRFYLVVKVHCS